MPPIVPDEVRLLIPYETHSVARCYNENAPATGIHNPTQMRTDPVHQMYGRLSINAARKSRQLDVDPIIFFLLFIGHRHPSGRSCTSASPIILFTILSTCNTSGDNLADYPAQTAPRVSRPTDCLTVRISPTQGRYRPGKLAVPNFHRQFTG